MLKEITAIKQIPGNKFRRWFCDSYFSLIIWYESDKETIAGFQLCYDIQESYKAVIWKEKTGLQYGRIDTCSKSSTGHPQTPTLTLHDREDISDVIDQFLLSKGDIETTTADFIHEKLVS